MPSIREQCIPLLLSMSTPNPFSPFWSWVPLPGRRGFRLRGGRRQIGF